MGFKFNNVSLQFVFGYLVIQICSACSSGKNNDDTTCWYTLWYIWFVLGLFIIVFAVLVILYIKHRTKERSRVQRLHRNQRSIQVSAAPQLPPSYTEPSHKPPTYEEALAQPINNHIYATCPGVIPGYMEDYSYQPPPTSMRMASSPNSPQQRPPSYMASTQGQGHPVWWQVKVNWSNE